jgi:hypothetical protein
MAQAGVLLFVFIAALIGGQAAVAPNDLSPQPAPVLENVELMELMVKPAYDELKQTLSGPLDDRKSWALVYRRAARLAELENLLFFRTRAGDARQAEWVTNAARARDASAALAALALVVLRSGRPVDAATLQARFPTIAETCTACHRAFAREAPVIKP